MTPENVILLGYEPYRIDLLMDVEGVVFEECFERRVEVDLDGVNTKFLSLHDLIISIEL